MAKINKLIKKSCLVSCFIKLFPSALLFHSPVALVLHSLWFFSRFDSSSHFGSSIRLIADFLSRADEPTQQRGLFYCFTGLNCFRIRRFSLTEIFAEQIWPTRSANGSNH